MSRKAISQRAGTVGLMSLETEREMAENWAKGGTDDLLSHDSDSLPNN